MIDSSDKSNSKIEILKKIASIQNRCSRFGYLIKRDGVTCFESIDGEITQHVKLDKHSPAYDEFCLASKHICSGAGSNCSIGNPSKKCIENKTYNKEQCGLISLKKIDLDNFNVVVSLSDLELLLSNF